MFYSITIRPKIEDFDIEWGNLILNHFDNIIVGYEHGENDTAINHFQVALSSSVKRSDSLRRSLKKLLNYNPDNPVWLVIKSSNDSLYTMGYCMKEDNFKYKGFSEEEITEALTYYKVKSEEINNKLGKTWIIKSINALPQGIVNHKLNNPHLKTTEDILMDLFLNDLIPLSLLIKVKLKPTSDLLCAYTAYKSPGGTVGVCPIPSKDTQEIIFELDKKDYDIFDKCNLDSYY